MAISVSTAPSGSHSRALALGLKLLTHLGAEPRALSLGELAAYASSGKPSVLRLLRTLERLGYVARDGNNKYRLSGGHWSAPAATDTPGALRSAAAGLCRGLHNELGETVSLACLFEDQIRVVDVLESPQHIRMTNFPGRILQPYASSLGKAVAAFQDENLIGRLLQVYGVYPLTKHTLTDQAAILAEFEGVRQRGYAVDDEETVEGGYCVGAPIRSPSGRVLAALSVSTPKFRASAQLMERLPGIIKGAAERAAAALAKSASGAETAHARSAPGRPE